MGSSARALPPKQSKAKIKAYESAAEPARLVRLPVLMSIAFFLS
jgi:hypothetical protein